jgi:hypothetical protein
MESVVCILENDKGIEGKMHMSASEILQQSRKDCAALPAIIITIDPRFRQKEGFSCMV